MTQQRGGEQKFARAMKLHGLVGAYTTVGGATISSHTVNACQRALHTTLPVHSQNGSTFSSLTTGDFHPLPEGGVVLVVGQPHFRDEELAKQAATRALGSRCEDPEGARLEESLTRAVNMLGIGPQGLGGDSTAFAVHVETAATHITLNPVAVNMQCHSARRARATFRPGGIEYGF